MTTKNPPRLTDAQTAILRAIADGAQPEYDGHGACLLSLSRADANEGKYLVACSCTALRGLARRGWLVYDHCVSATLTRRAWEALGREVPAGAPVDGAYLSRRQVRDAASAASGTK